MLIPRLPVLTLGDGFDCHTRHMEHPFFVRHDRQLSLNVPSTIAEEASRELRALKRTLP
jgi:hypothetical protein